jgi:hypothetical protein
MSLYSVNVRSQSLSPLQFTMTNLNRYQISHRAQPRLSSRTSLCMLLLLLSQFVSLVDVSIIASVESERLFKHLKKNFLDSDDFVTRINSIHYSEKEHTATIGFENRNATQTALMVCVVLLIIYAHIYRSLKKNCSLTKQTWMELF